MIRLEEFTTDDFDRFIGWIDNETFMYQFAGPVFTYPVTEEQLSAYIADTSRKVFRVIDEDSERVIGHGEISRIDLRNKNARLSRILVADEEDRKKGFGTLIITELLKTGFEEMDLHRIDLGVFEFNKPAIRCYEKCGFRSEGLKRESFLIDNHYHSILNMSILRHEWENRQ